MMIKKWVFLGLFLLAMGAFFAKGAMTQEGLYHDNQMASSGAFRSGGTMTDYKGDYLAANEASPMASNEASNYASNLEMTSWPSENFRVPGYLSYYTAPMVSNEASNKAENQEVIPSQCGIC